MHAINFVNMFRRVLQFDPLYEMIKKEEFERQYNSKFLEAISCSRVVVEPCKFRDV